MISALVTSILFILAFAVNLVTKARGRRQVDMAVTRSAPRVRDVEPRFRISGTRSGNTKLRWQCLTYRKDITCDRRYIAPFQTSDGTVGEAHSL